MYNLITDRHQESVVIVNARYDSDEKSIKVGSAEELGAKLQKLARGGDLPITLTVDAGAEPFFSEGHAKGFHDVIITGYIPAKGGQPAKVMIANSWGVADDHGIERPMKLSTLYKATIQPQD
jgi:hypothetical protein